jgi:protein-disulfide isomerase
VIDGQRALSAASNFKLDLQKVLDAANQDGITDIMKAHVKFADTYSLNATPAYLVGDVAIQGHPGRKSLQGVVSAVRKCGKAVC